MSDTSIKVRENDPTSEILFITNQVNQETFVAKPGIIGQICCRGLQR